MMRNRASPISKDLSSASFPRLPPTGVRARRAQAYLETPTTFPVIHDTRHPRTGAPSARSGRPARRSFNRRLSRRSADREARALPTMAGLELAGRVTTAKKYEWTKGSIELTSAVAHRVADPSAAPLSNEGSLAAVPKAKAAPAPEVAARHRVGRLTISASSKISFASWWITAATLPSSLRELPPRTFLALKPHGVFLSNGPGDPEPILYAVANIRKLLRARPRFSVSCLGHQLCGLALWWQNIQIKNSAIMARTIR